MKIKELESKKLKTQETFKEFYKYFKKYNYNISIKTIKNMYKIYVS